MSERAKSPEAGSGPVDVPVTRPEDAPVGEVSDVAVDVIHSNGVPAAESKEEPSVTDIAKDADDIKASTETEKPAEATEAEKPAEATEATEAEAKTEAETKTEVEPKTETADQVVTPDSATPASAAKSKSRRKSSGIPEHKTRKLNKKESKAKMSNLDAQPGEYYFIKFKGYPKWPGIIASDDMLPEAILKTRPVTAAKPDGTYREDFADGGKNALDRTFPVMFLDTNEFAWVPNTDFEPLDVNLVGEAPQGKMSKSLYAAYQLAAENHDLDYFKSLLQNFEKVRQEAAEASKAKTASKKSKKSKDIVEDEVDEDVEMGDAEEIETEEKPKASKKRKAATEDEETATPKRTDSVKKPKLKLINSTPKGNGAETPKSAKEKKEKAKPKAKKAANGTAAEPPAPKEPELSPEEKRKMKEKEILFLRHKLQKGLLTRDQRPKEEEMKQMSEFITKLEGYSDLEVSIIRVTKINKVLKAILKLDEIPKEAEFKFKERSTELLGKWNKILESETPATVPVQTNGTSKELVNGESAKTEEETKTAEPEAKNEDAAAPEAVTADADVAMEDVDAEKGDAEPEAVEEAAEEAVEEAVEGTAEEAVKDTAEDAAEEAADDKAEKPATTEVASVEATS